MKREEDLNRGDSRLSRTIRGGRACASRRRRAELNGWESSPYGQNPGRRRPGDAANRAVAYFFVTSANGPRAHTSISPKMPSDRPDVPSDTEKEIIPRKTLIYRNYL